MNEISAIFLKSGSSESLYEIKDALVRSYALSTQDLSFGIGPGGDTIDLSAKGILVGSVDLSGTGGGTAITLYDEIVGQIVQATQLSIMKLTRETYDQISAAGQLLSDCLYIVDCEVPSDLSSFTNSPGYLSSVPDSYKTYDDTKASLSTDGYATEDDLTAFYLKSETSSKGQISGALGEKADISSIPLSTSQLANDSGFIVLSDVSIPTDLSSFTNSPGYLTAVPDTYKTYFQTKDSLSSDGYAITSQIPLSTSQLTNDSGFLTEHQSLSDYYQKSETSSASQISSALSSIGDSVQVSSDLSSGIRIGTISVDGVQTSLYAPEGSKVTFDNRISGIVGQNDLSIVKLSSSEYATMLSTHSTLSNCLYVVEESFVNAYGSAVRNVGEPSSDTDAATKGYVDGIVPLSTSQLVNDSGFLESGALSTFYGIANPKASVNSIQETLISVLNVLRNLS